MDVPVVLVVGATGRIGRSVLDHLSADQAAGRLRLAGLAHRSSGAEALAEAGIEARTLDLDRAELEGLGPVRAALRGVDRLFLLTGYDVRMMAHGKAVIDAAVAEGVGHIVHLGAHAARDTTVVHLGWHQLLEAYLEQSGPAFTHLHPTSLMQNLPMLFSLGGADPGLLPHPLGAGRQSWVHADDVAAVAAHVLRDPPRHAGEAYVLGAENLSMPDIATLLAEVTGRPWRDEPRPPGEFLAKVTAAGADPVYMACVANIFRRVAEGSLPDLEQTSDTVRRLLGRPARTFRDYLEETRPIWEASPSDLAAPA